MPHVKVYIHFIWSTKDREALLNSRELRRQVWDHIKVNASSKGIYIDTINGYHDHCHALISLTTDQTIRKLMQLIKGESSYWINKNKLTKHKFEWQDEYFAVSVSPSQVEKVRAYIRDQEKHHKHITVQQELDELIVKCGFQKFAG
jgi:REP element-mobilizing transposase RayT